MNIVVLSPHRDDAAFSLALAIKAWLAVGHRVTIIGVFTRSLNAPYSDADTVHPNDLLSYVSAMRRREDAEFLKLMPGLTMVDVNLKDAPLRLRCTTEDVYTLPPNPEDTAVTKIHKAVARLAAEDPVDAMLLPLALGHHVDHLVVRNAALALPATHALAFYEDLPDAFQAGVDLATAAEAELTTMRGLGLFVGTASPLVLRANEEAKKTKRRIISVYASQIDDATIETISRSTVNSCGGERIWANLAWIESGLLRNLVWCP